MVNTLEALIPIFFQNNEEANAYKKIADKYKAEIKDLMDKDSITEIQVDNLIAKYSVSERIGFIEELLIERLKSLKKKTGIVKKREYVDYDALEDAIYNGKINASTLADCQEVKEVVTLRVSKVKKEKKNKAIK